MTRDNRWNQWVAKRVRMKTHFPDNRLGTVIGSAGKYTYWLVQWDDGRKTKVAERYLEVVSDDASA